MSFIQRASLGALVVIIDLLLFFVPLAAVLVWFPRLVDKIYRESA